MKNIIALCRCVKIDPKNSKYEFHFKGVYSGNKISKILVSYKGNNFIDRGEDYLLYIGDIELRRSVLLGNIWRIKRLDNIYS